MAQPIRITSRIRLRDFNPDYCGGLEKDETRDKTRKLCERIGELQHLLYASATHAVIILLQGMDGSGKDSTGASVLEFVTPAGVQTTNFKGPSAEELAHDFLWRIHKAAPSYGCIGLFNRSHYEDVLIVRVLGLQPEKIWRARYEQINAFEKLISDNRVDRDVSFQDFFLSPFRTTREAYRGFTACSCVDSRPNMSGCTMPIGGTHVHCHRQPDSSKYRHRIVSATTLVRREYVGPPAGHLHARYPLSREVSRRAGGGDK